MKLFVVVKNFYYDCGRVLGVFRHFEDAKAMAQRFANDMPWNEEKKMFGGNYDSDVSIEEFVVVE